MDFCSTFHTGVVGQRIPTSSYKLFSIRLSHTISCIENTNNRQRVEIAFSSFSKRTFPTHNSRPLTQVRCSGNGTPSQMPIGNRIALDSDQKGNPVDVKYPSSAETARTILSLCQEGTVSLSLDQETAGKETREPVSVPVFYFVGKESEIFINLPPELQQLLQLNLEDNGSLPLSSQQTTTHVTTVLASGSNSNSNSNLGTTNIHTPPYQHFPVSLAPRLGCLTVQPLGWPSRHLGAISLVGLIDPEPSTDVFDAVEWSFGTSGALVTGDAGGRTTQDIAKKFGQFKGRMEDSFRFKPLKCLFFGGLDKRAPVREFAAVDFLQADPDVLRGSFKELSMLWNKEHPEELSGIIAHFLGVPSHEVEFVELLWLDRLGFYAYAEVLGRPKGVIRVPFYRPVTSPRDAKSVMTMAAQVAWEALNKIQL